MARSKKRKVWRIIIAVKFDEPIDKAMVQDRLLRRKNGMRPPQYVQNHVKASDSAFGVNAPVKGQKILWSD